ncbi:MAG: hypothetical protein RMJ87_05020 [Cytophagales bacterium]|nr:hypothetical protein [Bernardetiaceae bacterium]MDW8204370.1 hypothetical protein [Cytophagales bacterium]
MRRLFYRTKPPVRLLLAATAVMLLSACIKLEERNIKLTTDCEPCMRMLKDSLSKEKGVYWLSFQPQTRQLHVKYDTSLISGQEIYLFLVRHELVRTAKNAHTQPACCR